MSSIAGKKNKDEFPASMEMFPQMRSFIREKSQKISTDSSFLYRVELACEEALINVIKHAYEKRKTGTLSIECSVENSGLKVLLTDQGIPFNPLEYSIPKKSRDHGLGIPLMMKSADKVFYERKEGENRLILSFQIRK